MKQICEKCNTLAKQDDLIAISESKYFDMSISRMMKDNNLKSWCGRSVDSRKIIYICEKCYSNIK